jgi:hypothetical protein
MHTSGASRRENASARPVGCLKIESEITPKLGRLLRLTILSRNLRHLEPLGVAVVNPLSNCQPPEAFSSSVASSFETHARARSSG